MTHPVQRAIDILMAVCDGARSQDNAGFSKADVSLIHYDGAPEDVLEDSGIAQRLVKYHRQLGEDLTRELQQLADAEKQGAASADIAGVIYVEEGYLKLYVHRDIRSTKTDTALLKARVRKYKHPEHGFTFVEPKERILHLKAAGFRVADRTLEWCAKNYGGSNDYDLF